MDWSQNPNHWDVNIQSLTDKTDPKNTLMNEVSSHRI